ncbi:MAG: TaqI-like C-terminal specificity domain-containing protein [Rikenellaceae bacterium]
MVADFYIRSLKDYGRPFHTLMTRAQGVVMERRSDEIEGSYCDCYWDESHHRREILTFVNNPKTVINFWATTQDMECIEVIFNAPHTTLKGVALWGLGIVTGDNRRHTSKLPSEEFDVGVVRGCDINIDQIAEPALYINHDLSRYQQSAPRDIYCAPEKLLYRFISKRLLFFLDTEQRYPLNSANCVVVSPQIGASSGQIAALLNSKVMNWLFERLYRSHKILRSDIETLPLHVGYFDLHDNFDEESYCEFLGIERREDGGYRMNDKW